MTERRKARENNLEKLEPIDLLICVNKILIGTMFINHMISKDYKLYSLSQKHYFDKSEIERLIGTLSFEDATVGKIFENNETKRPKTDVPKLRLRAKSPARHQEVSNTEREIYRRSNSASFQSIDNNNRHAIGVLEFPFLLKVFKSSIYFLHHIAYMTNNYHAYS